MIRIGITGNPGVGKHTIADLLSKKIKNSKIINKNKIILKKQAFNYKTYEADLKKTRLFLLKELINDDNVIVIGHLLPYGIKRKELDFIAILRKSPYSLLDVYEKRKYSNKKLQENILCEILGICFYDTLKVFGKLKISEIDTTSNDSEESVKQIIWNYDHKSKKQIGLVYWIDESYTNEETITG